MRKTPIRHKVKAHKRNGKRVRSFSRGKGVRKRIRRIPVREKYEVPSRSVSRTRSIRKRIKAEKPYTCYVCGKPVSEREHEKVKAVFEGDLTHDQTMHVIDDLSLAHCSGPKEMFDSDGTVVVGEDCLKKSLKKIRTHSPMWFKKKSSFNLTKKGKNLIKKHGSPAGTAIDNHVFYHIWEIESCDEKPSIRKISDNESIPYNKVVLSVKNLKKQGLIN